MLLPIYQNMEVHLEEKLKTYKAKFPYTYWNKLAGPLLIISAFIALVPNLDP